MATFTQLDDPSAATLARGIGLGSVTRWAPIAAGTINSNFDFLTDAGRFFVRIVEGTPEADVRYELALVAALAQTGVPTPVPLPGEAFHDGKRAIAFPWVEGVHRCQAGVTPADAAAVGAALARLHVAGADLVDRFSRDGIYTFEHIVERFEGFRDLDDPALAEVVPAIADEIDWLRERASLREAATRGIIHADLFRDNVLFDDNGVAALIDFEQACVGSLAYDLAVLINAWCYGDDFDGELQRAMVGGYRDVRTLTPADLNALPIECRAAAMRFCVTRVTDIHLQETVSTKDFRRYLARLERWRSAGVAGLARDLGLDLL